MSGSAKIPPAQPADLFGQGGGFLHAEPHPRHRHIGGQPAGHIGGHAAFERLQPERSEQRGQPGFPARVGQAGTAKLLGHLGHGRGHGAVLLGQSAAQHAGPRACLPPAAPQPVTMVDRAAQVARVGTDAELAGKILNLNPAASVQHAAQRVQPVNGGGITAYPAQAAPLAPLADMPCRVFHHKVVAFPPWAAAAGRRLR